MDSPRLFLHLDQPHRAFDNRTAAHIVGALVRSQRPVRGSPKYRAMDFSDLVVRLRYRGPRLHFAKDLCPIGPPIE